ncbi:hypothetical protein Sgly_2144 [Syntrophobotulus glycolicus DSM 8271]|uniref:Uncharacterized protein n=1 Tax=Syntrophobotulus glycolicus (strain DSM 8271 / FlGlyR) TaxID=645991 RepID=F0T2N4_SYNGF|nr:hypothetical protein [Syntrophobotulus glycolicus]ADY56433.1 hypothetical protein Sgly_2144 [Syntrophobotulus glycolicus DSM 8271]
MMNKKRLFKPLPIGAVVLSLAVVLFGNVNHVYSKTSHSDREIAIKDLAVENFNIDTTKVKQLYRSDLRGDSNVVSNEIKNKTLFAFTELIKNGGLKEGDYTPVYFLEGNNVSIAVKHADGSMTMTNYDISGDGEPSIISEDSKKAR